MSFTQLETKILAGLASYGGNKRVSVEELADLVGCGAQTIYKRLQDKPEFADAFKRALSGTLLNDAPEVMRSFVDRAIQGSFKHQKLFFEMAGMHQDKKTIHADLTTEEPLFKDKQEEKDFLMATVKEALGDSDA